jgi:hypothetical protein
MQELQQLKRGLQDEVASWYHWRPIQSKFQKELDQAKKNLSVFRNALRKRNIACFTRPQAQNMEALKEIHEETDAERSSLESAVKTTQMKLDEANYQCDCLRNSKERISFMKSDLTIRWHRLQRIQAGEFRRLGLRVNPKGPTTQASAAGFPKPITHPSTEMSKDLAPEESNRPFKRSSRKRSRDGK